MARKKKDPTLRVLSVDWDYFVGASLTDRVQMFPDGGNENLPQVVRDIVWASRYAESKLDRIPVLGTLETFMSDLSVSIERHAPVSIWIVDSHAQAYQVIKDTYAKLRKSRIELVNIDFHHDVYKTGEDVNCGNWLRILDRDLGTPECSYTWVGHPDSDADDWDTFLSSDTRNGKARLTDKLSDAYVQDTDWDVLFICRSDMWSPPHLDISFMELAGDVISSVGYSTSVMGNSYVLSSRYDEKFKGIIEQDRDLLSRVESPLG